MSRNNLGGINIQHPKTKKDFDRIHRDLTKRGYVAIDVLKHGSVRNINMALADAATAGAQDMAAAIGCGGWSNGPLTRVAWSFYANTDNIERPCGKDGKPLGDGYVKWGAADNIPSVIPPLAMSSPYTAAPLRYLADLTSGMGPHLMCHMPDGELVEYGDAGAKLQQRIDDLEARERNSVTDDILPQVNLAIGAQGGAAPQQNTESAALKQARKDLQNWENTWYGYDVVDNPEEPDPDLRTTTHVPGAKQFLDENNMDLHLSQCMQDNVNLDIYFPTIGLQRGRSRRWDYPVKPRITRVDVLPAHSTRLGVMDGNRYIHNVYFSDSLRTKRSDGCHRHHGGRRHRPHFQDVPLCHATASAVGNQLPRFVEQPGENKSSPSVDSLSYFLSVGAEALLPSAGVVECLYLQGLRLLGHNSVRQIQTT